MTTTGQVSGKFKRIGFLDASNGVPFSPNGAGNAQLAFRASGTPWDRQGRAGRTAGNGLTAFSRTPARVQRSPSPARASRVPSCHLSCKSLGVGPAKLQARDGSLRLEDLGLICFEYVTG